VAGDVATNLIGYCVRGASALVDHLGSDALYWPLGEEQFSIGGWLEANLRLDALALTDAQRTQLSTARAVFDETRTKSRPPYEQKVRREFKSRVDSLNWYLEDVREGSGYPTQASNRLRLALLMKDVDQPLDQRIRLEAADSRLRRVFGDGKFVLWPELEKVAPHDLFWFLYGAPRRQVTRG
jgi:hypothetical protein